MFRRDFMRVLFEEPDAGGSGGGEPPSPSLMTPVAPTNEDSLTGPSLMTPSAVAVAPPEDLSQVDLTQGRPNWVPEKYWQSEDDTIRSLEAVKAAVKLESQVSKMANGNLTPNAPQDVGEYFKGALFDAEGNSALKEIELSKDDPVLQKVAEFAMESGWSPAMFDGIVKTFLESSQAQMDVQMGVFREEQKAALGDQFLTLEMENKTFLEGLLQSQAITPEQFKFAYDGILSTADGMRLMSTFAKAAAQIPAAIPDNPDRQVGGIPPFTKAELMDRSSDPKYGVDKDFTAETDRGYEILYGTADAGGEYANPLG